MNLMKIQLTPESIAKYSKFNNKLRGVGISKYEVGYIMRDRESVNNIHSIIKLNEVSKTLIINIYDGEMFSKDEIHDIINNDKNLVNTKHVKQISSKGILTFDISI